MSDVASPQFHLVLDDLLGSGFSDAYAQISWSSQYAYIGEEQIPIAATN